MAKPSEPNASPARADNAPAQTKKPFRPPRFTVYGDLRRIALAKGGAKGDGLGKPSTKA
jgi:hypothetical protein